MIITDGEKIKAFGKGKLYISHDGEIFDNNFTRLNVEYDVKTGKPCIRIYNGGIELYFVETLVARTFVKKFAPGQQYIIHINEDVQDNRACNLKWVDAYEFMKHPADSNSYLKKPSESVYPIKDNRDKYDVDNTGSLVEIKKSVETKEVEEETKPIISEPIIAEDVIINNTNDVNTSYTIGKRLGETPEIPLPTEMKLININGVVRKVSKSGRIATRRKEIDVDKYYDQRFGYRSAGYFLPAILVRAFDKDNYLSTKIVSQINYLYHPSIINITTCTSTLNNLAVYRLENYSSDEYVFELMDNDTCLKTFDSYNGLISYWVKTCTKYTTKIGLERKGVYMTRDGVASSTYYWRLTLPNGIVISKCPKTKFDEWERPTKDFTVLSIKDTVKVLEEVNSKIIGFDYFDTKSIRDSIKRHAIVNTEATIADMASKVFPAQKEKKGTITKAVTPLEMQIHPTRKETMEGRKITIDAIRKYMATNTGHIIDMKTGTFVPEYMKTNDFYVYVNIEGIEYRIDELVLYAFYKKNPDGEERVIIHRNNNTMDNKLSNLGFVKKQDEGRFLPELTSTAN